MNPELAEQLHDLVDKIDLSMTQPDLPIPQEQELKGAEQEKPETPKASLDEFPDLPAFEQPESPTLATMPEFEAKERQSSSHGQSGRAEIPSLAGIPEIPFPQTERTIAPLPMSQRPEESATEEDDDDHQVLKDILGKLEEIASLLRGGKAAEKPSGGFSSFMKRAEPSQAQSSPSVGIMRRHL